MSQLTFAETKACCYLAYDGKKGEKYRFPDGSMWTILKHWATTLSGFKAILIVQDRAVPRTLKRSVLAFAGTDSIRDGIVDAAQVFGVLPAQYIQALLLARACKTASLDVKLCGHSLGGGLAAYSSVHTRFAASTINPAPLVGAAGFSVWFGKHPQIVNYIAGGTEFVSSSIGRTPGTDIAVPASGNFFTRHSLGNVDPRVSMPMKVTR